MREVYLDYNASAPLDERVVEVMLPVLSDGSGQCMPRFTASDGARRP